MDSFLGVPVLIGDRVYGNLYLTQQRSGQFSAEDEEIIRALAATAGFAIHNARMYAEAQRRQDWTRASGEITSALLASDDSNPIDLLVSRVLTLSGADLACVVVQSDDPSQMLVSAVKGDGEDELRGVEFPLVGSVAARVMEGKQPRILEDDSTKEVVPNSGLLLGPTMAVPLIASGRVLGVLIVSRHPGRIPFFDSDLELAADFAGRASVAMELAAARADRQRMLLLEDRGRIARDLHDHVIQRLFATGLELQGVTGMTGRRNVADKVVESVHSIDAAIAQIRTIIFALSGESSEGRNTIRHRVVDLVNELAGALPRTPRLEFAGPVDLVVTDGLAEDVLAVTREALTNIVKHATAENVAVTLRVGDECVDLAVIDDGVGSGGARRRSGLANIESRALARSGSCTFVSKPGRTEVRWSVPIPDDEPDED